MQLVALATGCFWLPAAAKLAWMTLKDENGQLTLWVNSCILCFAKPRAAGRDAAQRNPSKCIYRSIHRHPCARFRPFLTVPVQKLAGYEHPQRKECRISHVRLCRNLGENHYICASMVQFCHTIFSLYHSVQCLLPVLYE